ncbi:PEGA domain-containing protein [Candidatus Binatia bacterium]|nr:PEGA domain-containing protein [Candidatus Binatia bacterium]
MLSTRRALRMSMVVGLAAGFAGCAEHAVIRSSPPGAQVFVNDKIVGVSPVEVAVSRGDLGEPHRYRIVLDGYMPEEGELKRRFAVGRLFGAIFTSGILYIFRSPMTLASPVDVVLYSDGTDVSGAGSRDPGAGTPAERLRRLQDLYDQGLLTEQEDRRSGHPRLHRQASEGIAPVEQVSSFGEQPRVSGNPWPG